VEEVSLKDSLSPQKQAKMSVERFLNKKVDCVKTTRSFFDNHKLYIKSVVDYQTAAKVV
jgi:hypothetical protein